MKHALTMRTSLALLAALALNGCMGFVVVPVPLPSGSQSAPDSGDRGNRNSQE